MSESAVKETTDGAAAAAATASLNSDVTSRAGAPLAAQ